MIAWLLLCALLAGEDTIAQAKRLFEAGGQAYEQGRYGMAIDAFEAAYRLAPRGPTAFSTAQAYRLQYFIDGDPRRLARAIELYRAYLELSPTGNRREHAAQHLATLTPILQRLEREGALGADRRQAAKARTQILVSCRTAGARVRVDGGQLEEAPASFEVAAGKHHVDVEAPEHLPQAIDTLAVEGSTVALNVALDPRPGALSVRGPAGASVFVDGRLAGVAPLQRPVPLRPGRHVVALTDRGRRPLVRELDVGRGQSVDVTAPLELTTQRWVSYGLFGTGGALAVGAAVTWAVALGKQSEAHDYEELLDAGGTLSPAEALRYRALEGERDDLVRAGIVTGLLGVAAGAVGAVLYWTDRAEAPPPTQVTPMVSPGGAGAVLSGEF